MLVFTKVLVFWGVPAVAKPSGGTVDAVGVYMRGHRGASGRYSCCFVVVLEEEAAWRVARTETR